MKRVLTILALLLLPLSVWAMTPVSDSDLSNVTGQAGVNINANLTMDINIGTMAWGDSDGLAGIYNMGWSAGSTGGGYVGINGFNLTNLTIKARTETTDGYNHYNTLMLKPITIDVATGTKLGVSNTTFVRFGLGALQINMDALQFDVSLGQRVGSGETAGTNTIVLDQNMGVVSMGAMALYISPWSYVDIFAARTNSDASGVVFGMAVTLDTFKMNYMSWGDKDGYNTGNLAVDNGEFWMNDGSQTAGYIGLKDFLVNGPIAITGNVQIDVTTSAAGIYSKLPVSINHLVSSYSVNLGANVTDFLMSLTTQYFAVYMGWGSPTTYYLTYINTGPFNPAAYAGWLLGTYGHDAGVWAATDYAAAVPTPTSVVHISFPYSNFVVDVQGSMTGAVKLGNTYSFDTIAPINSNAATLGDIYIQGFKMTIKQGSWVDIWAH